MSLLPREIQEHYLKTQEWQRLSSGRGELERVRTHAIFTRELPSAPAVVVDIGGGAGVHAFWLAQLGYQVHLIDPVELHLEQARSHEAESGVALASIACGDARMLEIASGISDAVLLLGPLYHLTGLPHSLMDCRVGSFATLHFVKLLRPISIQASTAIPRTILSTLQLHTSIARKNSLTKLERPVLAKFVSSPSKALHGVRLSSARLGAIRRSAKN